MIQEITSKYELAVVPAAVAKNTAGVGVEIDTKPNDIGSAEYLTVLFELGANDSGLTVLNMQASDISGTYTGAYAGLDFSVAGQTLPAANSTNIIYAFHIDLRGKPRYWKLFFTTANVGVNGVVASATAILSRNQILADTASKRGVAQELFV